ncbi:uncharacterized protein LOC143153630 [Ptiloglossa arizonensis]|uniref:uncharacterized protein LOC143153630 n=1 Tax=Ptiloglossa arizonensis TaxID=3350558 RepID=UPI003FA14EFB
MRVKTIPRQRIVQDKNVEPVSEIIVDKFEKWKRSSSSNGKKGRLNGAECNNTSNASNKCTAGNFEVKESKNSDVNNEEEKETLDDTTEALDLTVKHKILICFRLHSFRVDYSVPVFELLCNVGTFVASIVHYFIVFVPYLYRLKIDIRTEITQKETWSRCSIAGLSSSGENSDSLSDEDSNASNYSDDNNNVYLSKASEVHCCCLAGPSSEDHSKSYADGNFVHDDHTRPEVVNLCKKDRHEDDTSNPGGGSDNKLNDTLLYKFLTDPTFVDNIHKHKELKRYKCQFCKQEFVNSDELADHMDVKKDASNQVICCACKKTFAQKRYLRYHQKCHSERTKYTCDICTKKYTRLDNLTRHSTVHVNPNKFSCMYCQKAFARKDLLNKHLKCHNNKHRFFCETCQKYFKGPLTLDNHKKILHSTT